MQPSIFTKIINGEIPSFKIYEDERTYTFLNINPVQPGHMLVVPREQVDHLEDLEDDDYEALMRTVKLLMQHVRDELQSERVCLRVEGFQVPHAHVHVIPCSTEDDVMAQPYEASSEELADMHERLSY
jgi:histidine triad (HIT) family protein